MFLSRIGMGTKKFIKKTALSLAFLMVLTGCGDIAPLTEDESEIRFPEASTYGDAEEDDGISDKLDNYLVDKGKEEEITTEIPIYEKSFTFTASGDDLIHSGIFRSAAAHSNDGTYDFTYVYENVAPFFKAHDINWINQETIVNTEIAPSGYPQFSTPGQCGEALYNANVKVFNLSTNHTYDCGAKGLEATLDFWNNQMPDDLLASGLWKKDDLDYIPIYEYDGIKIAFLGYTYGTNGIPTPEASDVRVVTFEEEDVIKRQLELANEQADMVIVSAHWGIEYSHAISDEQYDKAQKLADWGADLIIGTHPHVIQDAAWLTASDGRKVFCAYSLGNFVSTQQHPNNLVGLTLDCTLDFYKEGDDGEWEASIGSPKLIPNVTYYDYGNKNPYVMFLKDYTPEKAQNHGAHAYDSSYSYDKIISVLENNVSKEFLVMPDMASSTDAFSITGN